MAFPNSWVGTQGVDTVEKFCNVNYHCKIREVRSIFHILGNFKIVMSFVKGSTVAFLKP